MKRIVECPSCKTKMQIFDIGKEINQKCPRCKSSFEIHPEKDPKANAVADTAPAAAAEEIPAEIQPAPSAPQPGPVPETAAIKTESKTAEQPAEKKIQVKPPSRTAAKNSPASAARPAAEAATDSPAPAAEKPATEAATDSPAPAAEKPATEAATDSPAPAAEKPATEADASVSAELPPSAPVPAAKAAAKPSAITRKPAAAPKSDSPPVHTPEPPLAGFSGMQFMILFVMLLIAIIIQVFFAKKQMSQMSIINDNLKVIHSKM